MKKILFLFLFFAVKIYAQNYNIRGEVKNSNDQPIENATVTLLKQKDSSVINFLGTATNGKFSLKVPKQNEPTLLQISGEGTTVFSKKYETITSNIDLGLIKLARELSTNIEEVTITASPVRVKKDTIEYTASAIKVKPDDKIDELLKQIPGVEIDDDGKITVNGQPINKILINGKPFFNKDGKIALQTFNADIIKKIQITTSKTKEEELTGRTPKSDSLTVNFSIDEKNNRGNIYNLNLGYGTDKRYDSKLLLARFQQDRNLAFIAGANNINISDFSVDGFFEKGNRNNSANGRTANSGILKTSMIGFNYADKVANALDLEKFSIEYKDGNLDTYSKISRTTFLPDYKLENNSERSGNNDKQTFNFNTDASVKLDKLTTLIFSADFSNNTTENSSNSNSTTLRDDALLNSNKSSSRGNIVANSFVPKVGIVRKFAKPKRSLTASINNNFSETKNINYNIQETIFYQKPENNDYRNQRSENQYSRNLFGADFKFTEPVSDSATVSLEMNYDLQKLVDDRVVNDYNAATGDYSQYNSLLSNNLSQNNNLLETGLVYNLVKNKYTFRAGTNLNMTFLDLNSVYNSENYDFKKNFLLPEYNLMLSYKFNKNTTLRIANNSNYNIPAASFLNPYIDISNPLITIQGNPDLKSTWQNNSNINFNTFNTAKGLNFNLRAGFNYSNNEVVNYSYYDDAGKQFQTYTNLSGNKRVNFGTSFTKTFKWSGNRLDLIPGFNVNYSFRKGFIDGTQFTSNIYNYAPRFAVNIDLKDILNLRTTYAVNLSNSHYNNYRVDENRTSRQNLSVRLTNYFLKKNLFLSNDFTFTKNNNISSGFGKDSYFWNSSINYQFYKKQMMLKLSAYDLLNQRQNAGRTFGENFIEDREELILKRYFMLSLLVKLNKSGK